MHVHTLYLTLSHTHTRAQRMGLAGCCVQHHTAHKLHQVESLPSQSHCPPEAWRCWRLSTSTPHPGSHNSHNTSPQRINPHESTNQLSSAARWVLRQSAAPSVPSAWAPDSPRDRAHSPRSAPRAPGSRPPSPPGRSSLPPLPCRPAWRAHPSDQCRRPVVVFVCFLAGNVGSSR